jgi:hypothetical protein
MSGSHRMTRVRIGADRELDCWPRPPIAGSACLECGRSCPGCSCQGCRVQMEQQAEQQGDGGFVVDAQSEREIFQQSQTRQSRPSSANGGSIRCAAHCDDESSISTNTLCRAAVDAGPRWAAASRQSRQLHCRPSSVTSLWPHTRPRRCSRLFPDSWRR